MCRKTRGFEKGGSSSRGRGGKGGSCIILLGIGGDVVQQLLNIYSPACNILICMGLWVGRLSLSMIWVIF